MVVFIHASTDYDLIFADDERESNPTSFKFLQMARAWKNSQGAGGAPTSNTLRPTEPTAPSRQATAPRATSGRDRDDPGSGSDVASSHGGDD